MTRCILSFVVAALIVAVAPTRAAEDYPKTIVAEAKAVDGATTVTSTVSIHVDRLMEASRRTRVLDGLKYNGYQGFMNMLRPLAVVGKIETQRRAVDVRYAWETAIETGTRLVVVADKPLFFLTSDMSRARAGYELTVVELTLDKRGAGTGSMSGAARVKPAGDGGIVLEDFAASPVALTVAARK